jgi:hypothetical protein
MPVEGGFERDAHRRFGQRRGRDRRRWRTGRSRLAVSWHVQLRPDPCGNPLGQASRNAVWLMLDSRVVDVRMVYTEDIPLPKSCQESNIAGQYQAFDR